MPPSLNLSRLVAVLLLLDHQGRNEALQRRWSISRRRVASAALRDATTLVRFPVCLPLLCICMPGPLPLRLAAVRDAPFTAVVPVFPRLLD